MDLPPRLLNVPAGTEELALRPFLVQQDVVTIDRGDFTEYNPDIKLAPVLLSHFRKQEEEQLLTAARKVFYGENRFWMPIDELEDFMHGRVSDAQDHEPEIDIIRYVKGEITIEIDISVWSDAIIKTGDDIDSLGSLPRDLASNLTKFNDIQRVRLDLYDELYNIVGLTAAIQLLFDEVQRLIHHFEAKFDIYWNYTPIDSSRTYRASLRSCWASGKLASVQEIKKIVGVQEA